jgi:hypothetical protein
MDHQDSSGCRGCSNGHKLCSLAGPSLRHGRGPRTSGRHRTAARTLASPHGPRLRGQPDSPTGSGVWLPSGGSTPKQSSAVQAVRPSPIPQAQRDREALPPFDRPLDFARDGVVSESRNAQGRPFGSAPRQARDRGRERSRTAQCGERKSNHERSRTADSKIPAASSRASINSMSSFSRSSTSLSSSRNAVSVNTPYGWYKKSVWSIPLRCRGGDRWHPRWQAEAIQHSSNRLRRVN